MNIYEFERELKKVKEVEELAPILRRYLLDYNIATYSFTYYAYHPKSSNKLKYDIASKNFLSWHKHYVEENYDEVDSTMIDLYQSVLPVSWSVKEQLKNAKSERERQMRRDSIAFGADRGYCIPIHGPHGDFANLMVEQLQGEKCLEKSAIIKYELMLAAHVFYHYVRKLLLGKTPLLKINLPQRHIQCLQLLARHYSVPEIAKELHITSRTVNYHFQKINKKFAVKNKYQALNKVLEMGLLTL